MGSIDSSFWRTEVVRNPYVWYALAACIFIIVGLYQIEPIRAALSVATMSAADWAVSIGAGLLAMIIIRVGKHLAFFQNEKQ